MKRLWNFEQKTTHGGTAHKNGRKLELISAEKLQKLTKYLIIKLLY